MINVLFYLYVNWSENYFDLQYIQLLQLQNVYFITNEVSLIKEKLFQVKNLHIHKYLVFSI